MYCANCGTALTQGLSYCNRCGMNLKERSETNTGAIGAFLTAITIIAIVGLSIMLGGAVILRKEALASPDLVGIFMLFVFLITAVTELMLIRNLSKLFSSNERTKYQPQPPQQLPTSHDLRLSQGTPLGEPVPSVTENTTRTLEYARREQ